MMSGLLRRIALPAVAVAIAAAPAPLAALDEDPAVVERREHRETLEAITRNLEENRELEAELAAEVEALGDDRAALNERLIETAGRIQDAETEIAVAEDRLAGLVEREDAVRESLADRSGLLAELLGALQRMGRRPPPAVLVTPEDALKAVRSAILVGAVLPGVRVETEALASDLNELVRLKADIDRERARLVEETERMETERLRIAALADAKRAAMEAGREELDAVRARAEELAGEAGDLRELIAALDEEIAIVERRAVREDGDAANATGTFGDAARMEPAIDFASARGLLPKPASGAVIREFGASDTLEAEARGISIATREGAQVTAPCDGWVVYAGEFRSYGKLLILNAGDGYHILLAGMERISVEVGQFVLTGEPVGAMAAVVMASAANVTVEQRQPVLYVEFRKDGQSIDPAPWWADGRTGAGG